MLRWQVIALVHAKTISVVRSGSCRLTEVLVNHYSIPLCRYVTHVHPTYADTMCFKRPRPFLCSGAPTRGVELLMRVRMGSLCVHERTSRYGGSRANTSTACPACGQNVESLSHLMFDCPATSAQRDAMLDEIRSVLRPVVGGAEKLRNVLAMSDASTKLLRFISDDVWGSKGVCQVISRSISAYLVQGMCVIVANIMGAPSFCRPGGARGRWR
jgi:hypothetical protein